MTSIITTANRGMNATIVSLAILRGIPFCCYTTAAQTLADTITAIKEDLDKASDLCLWKISHSNNCSDIVSSLYEDDVTDVLLSDRNILKNNFAVTDSCDEEAFTACYAEDSFFIHFPYQERIAIMRDYTAINKADILIVFSKTFSMPPHSEPVVPGRLGRSVNLAKEMKKPIYLYDLTTNTWHSYRYPIEQFTKCSMPSLDRTTALLGPQDFPLDSVGKTMLLNLCLNV